MPPEPTNCDRSIRPIAAIDLPAIAEALDDRGDETTWVVDPATGQVVSRRIRVQGAPTSRLR
jgi:hypothetical protein